MIPACEGSHSVKPAEAFFSPVGVGIEYYFGVRIGTKAVACDKQLLVDFNVVIYFSVKNNDVLRIEVQHKLLVGGGVDDGQAMMSKVEPGSRRSLPAAGLLSIGVSRSLYRSLLCRT